MALRREQDVVADGLAEGRRLLEHHADGLAQLEEVLLRRVDVTTVVEDLTADAAFGDLAVHEVQAAQKRRLAAAGRPDERGHLTRLELERRRVQRLVVAVGNREVAGLDHRLRCERRCGRGSRAGGGGRYGRAGGVRVVRERGIRQRSFRHSLVSLLSRNLPIKRASTLNSRMHTRSTAAVPFETASRSGTTPSLLIFQI